METSLFPLFPKVTQAHARPNRTSPPVGLKPPAPHCAVDAPLPQRTPSEGETMTAGGQTAEVQASSARRPVQGTRRAAKDHSRGSSERNSVPFTDPVAFLEESLRYGQSSPGCSVSHAVKTEEGLEIPVERKVEGHQAGTLQVCEDRQALSQMKVEMEADVVAMKEIERAQIGATLDESQRETVFITHAGVSQTEMNNEPVLKSTVETHPIMHKTNITGVDTSNEQVTMEPGKINVRDTNVSEQQMNPLKEAHKPGPNVLSVAEIMRSQIKALESTLSNPLTVESNSATVESIASTPHIALSTEKAAAPGKFPDLREDLEKGHDMERVLAIEIEQKIETKPPEQPPKSTPPTTEPITSFSIPPYRGEDNVTAQDVERTIEKEQRVEAMPVSTPEVPDTAGKQVGLQPRLNPPECTPEQPQTKPQTPAAQTTEAITSFSRGALGTGLDVERPIDIKQKIETKPVSTPEVPDAAGKQVGLQPRLNPPECTPEQPQTEPQTPAAQTTEAITSFSRGALGTGLDVERPIDIKQKIETKPVSTPEVPDATAKQVGFQPRLNPPECTPEQPQTKPQSPTAPTTEAITCYSRGEDLGKELNVERPIEIESKMDTKSVSTPEVPDTTAKQFEFQPTIYQQTTIECTPNQPLTPTAPTSEAIIAFSIPPISVSDTESMAETGNTYSRMENDSIVDTGHACGTSSPVSLGDSPDPPPAAATDEMTTITCCSNASLMEVDFKDLTDSNSSVIMSQEHRKSLSSGETGMYSVVELCCTEDSEKAGPSSEQHSPKQSILDPSSTDEGFKQIPPPEIKLNSESHLKSTPVLSPTCVDAQNTTELNRSTVEIKQDDMIQQERNLFISIIEPTTTAIAPPTSSSNDEAPLQEVKSDAPTVPSATPKDLALGARRKIFTPKSKTVEDNPTTPTPVDSQPQSEEVLPKPSKAPPAPATLSVPPGPAQQTLLDVEPNGQRTPPVRRRSPLLSRKVTAQETLQQTQAPRSEEKSAEKEKHDPLKAATERQDRLDMDRIPCQLQESRECETPVIRKIRGESFSDASGHLKLWCQFFNVLSDSVISWYMDDVEIAQVKRSAGDETPVNLAIIQASKKDCGVYGCKITNDHGTDITDLLLSIEILGGMRLREDLGVGEEIEMAPLLLNKGVADCGVWGSKFFGRVMVQESHIGGGCSRKTWRAKVVYGLEPVFESGTTCVIKMCNRITYGGKGEAQLTERNVEMERQASTQHTILIGGEVHSNNDNVNSHWWRGTQ
ncbi:Alpha-protein kinase 3 [Merluccius polli]|uniref:non-specific serine/threonine protein kinase n=1 Tax=Merluccius polli TaxID=89951 RepID=A0AA47MJX4_MERPO|nr:Alpha-protein kinase 3 [Merluccius polli]